MENGTYKYDLEMSTPLGKRRGNLELTVDKDILNGCLTMFTRTIPIKEGKVCGSSITFSGTMQTLMSTLLYHAQGSISSSVMQMEFDTDHGHFPASGILTEMRKG